MFAISALLTLSFVGLFASSVLLNAKIYRMSLVVFIASSLTLLIYDYGFLTVVAIAIIAAIVMPVLMMTASFFVTKAIWFSVRKKFDSEPVTPPLKSLTFFGAYRHLWML